VKLIDCNVADSRDAALNHTAGLSLPQQVMMPLFSLAELIDSSKDYQAACLEIVNRRVHAMIDALGIQVDANQLFDCY
jgi:aspartate 4-decarboxylase